MQAQLQLVLERLQLLEARNQELERRVQALSNAAAPQAAAAAPGTWGSAAQVEQLERRQQALQAQVQSLAGPLEAAQEPADDGPHFEGGALAVLQRVNGAGSADGRAYGRANYRGDLMVTLPAGTLGDARGSAVAHLRFGQGGGVATRPTYTGAVNSTVFETGGVPDDSYAIVAEAYYRLDWALDGGRFNEQAGNRVELMVGKLDIFTVFDQNAVAGDEATQFLNNVFVHNPLLDSGGDIAVDAFGFAPGARVGYFNEGESATWGVSLGVFGAGPGRHLRRPRGAARDRASGVEPEADQWRAARRLSPVRMDQWPDQRPRRQPATP